MRFTEGQIQFAGTFIAVAVMAGTVWGVVWFLAELAATVRNQFKREPAARWQSFHLTPDEAAAMLAGHGNLFDSVPQALAFIQGSGAFGNEALREFEQRMRGEAVRVEQGKRPYWLVTVDA